MLTLDTLNVMLAVSEEGLIEEVVITLLASPQLAAFFEKFPKLRKAMTDDLPRWRDNLRQRFKETEVPPELTEEVAGYQQCQRLSTPQFIAQLQQTLTLLDNVHSPFASQARALVTDNPSFTPALHTLFLQRWRLSLVVQATALNQQLLDEEREQLLSEVQERMTLSGQLEQVLVENENAAGRLWDMSAGQLKRGDYQLIVKYGDFLAQQPELMKLAEQLGRSREARSVPKKDAPMETFRTLVREPSTVPEQVDGLQQSDDILRLLPTELSTLGMTELEYEFYRRLVEKELITYRLHGEAWREKISQRPVVHQDFDEQPRGPFIVCVDTSGSMGGFNEQCAKAFCLALMRVALADRRRCYIMLFSSEVVGYELTSPQGLEQAIRFLSQRFRGGTDLASCFRSIIERMQGGDWYDADAVVISDFIAQRLPDEVVNKVKEMQRVHQHRFHAVAMSAHGKPGIMRIFDHIWRLDTGLRSRRRSHVPAAARPHTAPDRYGTVATAAWSDETGQYHRRWSAAFHRAAAPGAIPVADDPHHRSRPADAAVLQHPRGSPLKRVQTHLPEPGSRPEYRHSDQHIRFRPLCSSHRNPAHGRRDVYHQTIFRQCRSGIPRQALWQSRVHGLWHPDPGNGSAIPDCEQSGSFPAGTVPDQTLCLRPLRSL